ncbi:MAG TPA: DUF2252 domain-containing protein [Acetobacteraceae bacterium]|nr:DUF2252 domain-containing protein [Acetobacteraceae bacterium]
MDAPAPPPLAPVADRLAAGAVRRRLVPRGVHAEWSPPADRADPIEILIAEGKRRIPELLLLRYTRMQASPFAFLRGAAAIMATDLEMTPTTGLRVQACGDCHLANFGTYASPEGIPLFDVNDFDETLPAPFEWDLKRLATSLAVAGRGAGLSDGACHKLARRAARAYRKTVARLAPLPPLLAWNDRVDLRAAIEDIDDHGMRRRMEKHLDAAMRGARTHYDLPELKDGVWTIQDKPDQVVHHARRHEATARAAFAAYAATLQEDRRVLLSRYSLRDVAFKVVGIGSVGTFCAIGLFVSPDDSPLILQLKEAQASVLAPHAGASAYVNQGERVVTGQRMLQAATDIFLGFPHEKVDGRYFYVRRLKDEQLAAIGTDFEAALPFHARLCGRTLGRAHARAGDAAILAGYMGGGSVFDHAIADFALAYADQTERDWQAFRAAIDTGRLTSQRPDHARPG